MVAVFAGGMRLTAARLNAATLAGSASVSSVETGSFSTNSTSYTTTGGNVCGVTFVAPPSGVVVIFWESTLSTVSTGGLMSFELRTGSTIGSGTSVTGTDDNRALDTRVTTIARPSNFYRQTGLTSGSAYNVRLLHRSLTGANTSILRRELTVIPVL